VDILYRNLKHNGRPDQVRIKIERHRGRTCEEPQHINIIDHYTIKALIRQLCVPVKTPNKNICGRFQHCDSLKFYSYESFILDITDDPPLFNKEEWINKGRIYLKDPQKVNLTTAEVDGDL